MYLLGDAYCQLKDCTFDTLKFDLENNAVTLVKYPENACTELKYDGGLHLIAPTKSRKLEELAYPPKGGLPKARSPAHSGTHR